MHLFVASFAEVPKLHIRRVGAHEAHSAVRAQELGDGTVECREAHLMAFSAHFEKSLKLKHNQLVLSKQLFD